MSGGNPAPGTTSPLPDLPPNDPNVGNSQTANYGLQLIIPSDTSDPLNLNTAAIACYAAIDSALASLTGIVALIGNLFHPTFDASGLTVSTDAGHLDYNLNSGNADYSPPGQNFQTGSPFQNGTTAIGGNSGVNSLARFGSIANDVLTIPINVDVQIDTGLIVVDAIFTGQIVTVIPDPEPSSVILAAVGGLGLLAWKWRRRVRSA